jgi:outer membrane protein TolC
MAGLTDRLDGKDLQRAGKMRSLLQIKDFRAATALLILLLGTFAQYAPAQTAAPTQNAQRRGDTSVPATPQPNATEPLYLRPTSRDFTQPRSHLWNPIAPYESTQVDAPKLTNSPRLHDLLRDGKIYLSLDDAITLALENNFDIAIARYNLDIADTEILRAHSGQGGLLGVPTGLVTGTQGGTGSLLNVVGGGPGGTTTGAGGAGTGSQGLALSTNGAGPAPEVLDPNVTGTVQYERAKVPQTTTFITGTNFQQTNTATYDFAYNQGFLTGTALTVGFNNNRQTSNSPRLTFNPALNSDFRAQVTQHLLQGFGTGINGRFIVQAKNNRRITDSSFRQQLLFTINQIENIYWGLVSAYEDTQAKERAIVQSRQLAADNRKQLQIGTLAPLDVVNADSQVAADQQALITSQSGLNYQQLLMKQAIARNLDAPELRTAPVIPTDRVSLVPTPEENQTVEELVQQAYANRPEVEQGVLTLKNNEITLKAVKNQLLPVVDAYAFYGGTGLGGQVNPAIFCQPGQNPLTDFCTPVGSVSSSGYSSVFGSLFDNSSPDKGVGVSINIPIRNRFAQSQQARAVIEYRQAQLRLQQIYITIRNQVENSIYALTNDRALVQSSQAAREYGAQQLEAEQKKYRFGASTTYNVLQQERNLAAQESSVISANAAYARDRAALSQILANTLTKYGISLEQSATGTISQLPVIPGLEPPKPFTQPPALEPGKVPQQAPMNNPVTPAERSLEPSVTPPQQPPTQAQPQTTPPQQPPPVPPGTNPQQ